MPSVEVPEPNLNPNLVPDAQCRRPPEPEVFSGARPYPSSSSLRGAHRPSSSSSSPGAAPHPGPRPPRRPPSLIGPTLSPRQRSAPVGCLRKWRPPPGDGVKPADWKPVCSPRGRIRPDPNPPGGRQATLCPAPLEGSPCDPKGRGGRGIGLQRRQRVLRPSPPPSPRAPGPPLTALSSPSHRPLNALGPPVRSTGVGPPPSGWGFVPHPIVLTCLRSGDPCNPSQRESNPPA